MSPFDIKARVIKPLKEGMVNPESVISEDEKTAVIFLGKRDTMDLALEAKDEMVSELKEKGLDIIRSMVFPSKERR